MLPDGLESESHAPRLPLYSSTSLAWVMAGSAEEVIVVLRGKAGARAAEASRRFPGVLERRFAPSTVDLRPVCVASAAFTRRRSGETER